jgi:hypothetical protein
MRTEFLLQQKVDEIKIATKSSSRKCSEYAGKQMLKRVGLDVRETYLLKPERKGL